MSDPVAWLKLVGAELAREERRQHNRDPPATRRPFVPPFEDAKFGA